MVPFRGGLPAKLNPPAKPYSLRESANRIPPRPVEEAQSQVSGKTLLKPYNPRATHLPDDPLPTKAWPEED
jgi:hypothetical protein